RKREFRVDLLHVVLAAGGFGEVAAAVAGLNDAGGVDRPLFFPVLDTDGDADRPGRQIDELTGQRRRQVKHVVLRALLIVEREIPGLLRRLRAAAEDVERRV